MLFKQRIKKKDQSNLYGIYSNRHNKKMEKIHQFTLENYDYVSINSRSSVFELDKWSDCYLVGSDQMWNPWMLSLHYLLDFVPNRSVKPKYSYATSFGVDNIPEDKRKVYEKYLPKFDKLSVREPRAAELVKGLSGKDATVVLDPTFLLTQEEWREFSNLSSAKNDYSLQKYILCYFIGSPEFNHLETAVRIAQELNMQIVLLPTRQSDYLIDDPHVTVIADACAYDFVSLIDNACLVCTDSFHAVVFSFLMETAFYDFPRFRKGDKYSQESRLMNVMNKFSLMDSVWQSTLEKQDILSHLKPDYSTGYSTLIKEREECTEFLKNMINNC